MQHNVPAKILPCGHCPDVELSALAPLALRTAQIARLQSHANCILNIVAHEAAINSLERAEDGVIEGARAAFLAFDADLSERGAATHLGWFRGTRSWSQGEIEDHLDTRWVAIQYLCTI